MNRASTVRPSFFTGITCLRSKPPPLSSLPFRLPNPFYALRSYWWEVLSLIHRTTLTGWLLLFDASQHFMQLLTALIVSLAYLMLLLVCRPFKRRLDHFLAAGCQLLVFFLFLFGLSVHLHHEIAHDVDGSLSLASRLLGLDSSDDIAVIMILIAIFMVILFGLTLLAESVAQHLEQRRAMTWSICTMDPPRIVWKRKRTYACFLSHYKMGMPPSPPAAAIRPCLLPSRPYAASCHTKKCQEMYLPACR